MKEELRYDWIDLLRAPRMALSLQKIWLEFPPLLAGFFFYVICTFLALKACGRFETVVETHGLLPCIAGVQGAGVLSWLLWLVGLAGLLASALFAGTAVARAAYLELKGETFFIYRELYAFALKHLKSTMLGPLGILAVIAGIAVCGLIVGLIGRIPGIGVMIAVGASPVWLGVSFFLVVLSLVLLFSVLLAPAVVATVKGDFFEVITETFSITFSQFCRMVWYQIVILAAAAASVAVLGALVKAAYGIMTGLLSAGMGEDFLAVKSRAGELLGSWFPWMCAAPASDAAGWLGFWAYVLAAVAAVAGFIVVACYGAAVVTTGNTIAYVVLHKIKDEEDLLELEDEEDEQAKPAEPAEPAEGAAPAPAAPVEPPAPSQPQAAPEAKPAAESPPPEKPE